MGCTSSSNPFLALLPRQLAFVNVGNSYLGVGKGVGTLVGAANTPGIGNPVGTGDGPEGPVPPPDADNTTTNPSAVTELSDVKTSTNAPSMRKLLDCPNPLIECAMLAGLALLPR